MHYKIISPQNTENTCSILVCHEYSLENTNLGRQVGEKVESQEIKEDKCNKTISPKKREHN